MNDIPDYSTTIKIHSQTRNNLRAMENIIEASSFGDVIDLMYQYIMDDIEKDPERFLDPLSRDILHMSGLDIKDWGNHILGDELRQKIRERWPMAQRRKISWAIKKLNIIWEIMEGNKNDGK